MAKNNLSYNNISVDYLYSGTSTNTNNLSSDNTAPAYGTYYRNATVNFSDAANKDFHLAAADTGARDKGADLSDDPIWQEMMRVDSINFPYGATGTDIDGHSRDVDAHSGAWDIGADEAATPVYFAVGQNTTDHKTGSPLITVDPDTRIATFTVAQTAVNMGVGDEIDYDTDNKKCYITDKISTTVWKCRTATGSVPLAAADATVNSVKHAFAALNSAVNATLGTHAGDSLHLNTTDLWTNNYQLNIPCYYDSGPDTTAVTVNGWTTGAPNYVKIYTPTDTTTEANARQRHWGKWDEGKLIFKPSSNPYTATLIIDDYYVYIEGLQIAPYNAIYRDAIDLNGDYGYITQNIIKGSGSDDTGIIISSGVISQSNIWNNTIYGLGFAGLYEAAGSNSSIYFNNNTIINCLSYGVFGAGDEIIAKNNIVQGSTNGYSENTFNISSDYNISDLISNAPSPSYRTGQATDVVFADETNSDFHLSPTDTAARNQGADLSADSNFAFSTDIDGSARNIDGQGWDIGADETATPVYYSVGQDGTTDRRTGSPTLTIASGTATFSLAQTDNIGVGDTVEYGSPTTTAYIAGKTDQSVWSFITATGAWPANVDTATTVHSIKRTFSSLSSAEATAPTLLGTSDLYTNNYQLNLPCYYDTGPDTTAVTIDGWTTAPQDYIKVYTPNNTLTEANVSQRHQGVWDEGKWSIKNHNGYSSPIQIKSQFSNVDGLQVLLYYPTTNIAGVYIYDYISYVSISNNIIKGELGEEITYHPFGIYSVEQKDVKIWNNIVYNFSGGIGGVKGRGILVVYTTGLVYNNTVYGSGGGIQGANNNPTIKNNIFYNNITDYSGLFNSASTNNLSSDNTAPAYGTYYRNATVSFVDPGNNDFHLLPTDTGAKDKGIEESDSSIGIGFLESLQSDIDGQERYDGYWDIGADEAPTILYRSVGNDQSNLAGDGNTVTISSSTATFANALSDNIGVGDVIQYGQAGYYELAFITGRASSTQYSVQSRTGVFPSATTTAPAKVFRAHEFLDDWEDQVVADVNDGIDDSVDDLVLVPSLDLDASNTAMFVPCYASTSPDNLSTTIDSWTSATTSYIKIYTPVSTSEVGASQRHQGKWDEGKYRIHINSANEAVYIPGASYLYLDGLQIFEQVNTSWDRAVLFGNLSGFASLSNMIIKGEYSGGATGGTGIEANGPGIFYLYNNIIYGFKNGADSTFYALDMNNEKVYAYNNTIFNNYRGIYGGSNFVAKNNIAYNNDNADFFNFPFSASSTHNLSSDNTAPAYGIYYRNATVNFVDSDNADFHLLFTDATAKNTGIRLTDDPYLSFNTDIDGATRSSDKWDIGADEAQDARVRFRGTNFRIEGKVRIE